MQKSFFEFVGLADVEKVHSQVLAWVLNDDCDAISKDQRKELLNNLFKVYDDIEYVWTEVSNIDILIKTKSNVIVIENKIKSSQHSNQLAKYRDYCRKSFPTFEGHFFLLTLFGEQPEDQEWHQINYSTVYDNFKNIKLQPGNNHTAILNEYIIFLERLNNVITDFKDNSKNYDFVFLDGMKKKEFKNKKEYDNENDWFVASNQLETIFQKGFLYSLTSKIIHDKIIITGANQIVA